VAFVSPSEHKRLEAKKRRVRHTRYGDCVPA
jgi:hypothetical protein